MKACLICREFKPHTEFHRQSSRRDGYCDWCKLCKSQIKKKEYEGNRAAILVKSAEYRKAFPEKVAAAKASAYRNNREHYRARSREKYLENREAILKYSAEYRAANRERKSATDRAYVRRRMKEDPAFKMSYAIRCRIGYAFRSMSVPKTGKTKEMLGCDWGFLKAHIEGQFLPGMSWENRGDWHIDHIIPLASATTVEEMEALCHYSNLQPLWAADNIRKGARIAA